MSYLLKTFVIYIHETRYLIFCIFGNFKNLFEEIKNSLYLMEILPQ